MKTRFLPFVLAMTILAQGGGHAAAGSAGDTPESAEDQTEKTEVPEDLHIYAIAGAVVSEHDNTGEDGAIVERCFILNPAVDKRHEGHTEWMKTKNRVQWIPARLSKSGLAYGFVKAMQTTNKDIAIGLVVVDEPGTMLVDWHRKSEPFRRLRRMVHSAGREQYKGLLWRHSVSVFGTALDPMKNIFAGHRGDYGLNVPIVVGEFPGDASLNAQLDVLRSDVHALGVASVDGLLVEGKAELQDGGLAKLGERYAEQMLKIQKEWAPREKVVRPRSDIPSFDAHVHGGKNLETLKKWMDKNNVTYCINLVGTIQDEKTRHAQIEKSVEYKDRILSFTSADPNDFNSVEEAVEFLEKEKAAGVVGFGEFYGYDMMFDDPKILRVYAACEKLGFPVLFHSDGKKNMMEKRMARLERVLEMFPKLILIAHAGWWGGLSDGTCDRLLQKYPNLYADTSATDAVMNRDRRYTREFLIRNADKILYGSDEGWWSLADAVHNDVGFFKICDEINLPEEVKDKIYRRNAMRLFGIKE